MDRKIHDGELIPKHGPGKTADRLDGNQKWTFPTWHSRLEHLFPYGEYGVPGPSYVEEGYSRVELLDPVDEPPTRLVAIPKTQTTPRLIASEPTVMQYLQQAIGRETVVQLESHEDSSWFLGFTEQWPNQALAQIGSEDGSLATLDLSEASDRVANWHVEDLFQDFPWFLEGIQACRSQRAKLPSGKVIDLQKFASMGSAMTFPIEAMVFTAIAIERVLTAFDLPLSRKSIRTLRDRVRVYGDDIIVPSDTAETVIDGLETFGFKVNRAKSFWTGGFRESCGKEYFAGEDVSIVRFRTVLPTSLRNVTEIVSTVSTRNQLYKAGMWRTAALLDGVLEKILRGKYPFVEETSSVLGKHGTGRYDVQKYHVDYQAPVVHGWVVTPEIPENGIDGVDALMKCLLETIGEPNTDEEHLTRSGRPWAVGMKLRWAPPF